MKLYFFHTLELLGQKKEKLVVGASATTFIPGPSFLYVSAKKESPLHFFCENADARKEIVGIYDAAIVLNLKKVLFQSSERAFEVCSLLLSSSSSSKHCATEASVVR